jgi:hypothetical protein
MMACYAPMVLVIFAARSTYRRKLHNTLVGEFMAVQTTAALAAMLLLAGMVLTGVPGDLSDTITKVWLTTAFFLPAGRIAAILVTRSLRRHSHLQSPTLIPAMGQSRITWQNDSSTTRSSAFCRSGWSTVIRHGPARAATTAPFRR